jgi:hypothetical protein
MNRILRDVTLTASVSALALLGCNTILKNEPGVLAETDEDATRPPPCDGGAVTDPPQVDPPNGEEPPDAGQVPSPACPDGERICDGVCVANDDPEYGCGDAACRSCPSANATATCLAGACAIAACDPGYADCNENPVDGCESDLSRAATCGACDAPCPPLAPICAPLAASYECTVVCLPDAPTLCGDECVDILTSKNHCGACDAPCPAVANGTTSCTAGVCTFECKGTFRKCEDRCVTRTDPTACGPACVVCPVPPNARATCAANACGFVCDVGYGDCDADPVTGCEAVLASDPENCGGCGISCNGGACVAGACEPVED